MWPLNILVLTLCCHGYLSSGLRRIHPYFKSKNFFHELHWEHADLSGQTVLYSVWYNSYGNPSQPVMNCQNITVPLCDLTEIIINNGSQYHIQITGNNQSLGEYNRFWPIEHTVLGAPQVSVSQNESSLSVTVIPPPGPGNRSLKQIICMAHGNSKPPIRYTAIFTHPTSVEGRIEEGPSGHLVFHKLEAGQEYCGYVLYSLTHPMVSHRSENSTFCVTLPGRPWLHTFILPALLVCVLLVTLPVVVCQHYVKKRQKMPDSLNMSRLALPLRQPYLHGDFWKVEVSSGFVRNMELKSEVNLLTSADLCDPKPMGNEGSYTAQDSKAQAWHANTYSGPQNPPEDCSSPSSASSTNYSMVVHAQVTTDQAEEKGDITSLDAPGQQQCLTGERTGLVITQNMLPREAPPERKLRLMEGDQDENLLVLPVLRGTDGLLQLSSLLFQQDLSALSPATETFPLLSNFTSGMNTTPSLEDCLTTEDPCVKELTCARTYLPNQIPPSAQESPHESPPCHLPVSPIPHSHTESPSSYKSNWIPGMPS